MDKIKPIEEKDELSDAESSLPPSELLFGSSSSSSSDDTSKHESGASSSADVQSIISQDEAQLDGKEIANDEKEKFNGNENLVHGHILPKGWKCRYDSTKDAYKFEPTNRPKSSRKIHVAGPKNLSTTLPTNGSNQKSGRMTSETDLVEGAVQTSRRPTLDRCFGSYGYHFPTSPTASMISELAKQVQKTSTTGQTVPKKRQVGYGKTKLFLPSEEEDKARRLREMFPTAPIPIVDQMIRIYHGREGLIKAALISLGYKRATEYNAREATAQSPIMLMMSKPSSKKLFDKLVGYFPYIDEALIKELMYKHKEVEHEIISVLVESNQSDHLLHSREIGGSKMSRSRLSKLRADHNGAIMKLRYLKCLFPSCEEIELYHLLHRNDLSTHSVIEVMEKRGYKRANIEEVMKNRKSQSQQMRAQTAKLADSKDKTPLRNLVELHRSRTKPTITESRVSGLKESLRKNLANEGPPVDDFDDDILIKALEAADYNESLARKFLREMQPINEKEYTRRYCIMSEQEPQVVMYPCKAIQKSEVSFMSVVSNEFVCIPREIAECRNALALLKVDASTYTEDDFPAERQTKAKGRQLDLREGPKLIIETAVSRKSRIARHKGSNSALKVGSNYLQIVSNENRSEPGKQAKGSSRDRLAQGSSQSLRCGHNAKLLTRDHPFFKHP